MLNIFGYKIHFTSRYHLLSILFASIKDKSRIHLQQELLKIEILGDKVRAVTKKGLEYTADLLVGADGVRSMTRQKLWRIADSESPGYIPHRDKTGSLFSSLERRSLTKLSFSH